MLKHETLALGQEKLLEAYYFMLLARRLDERLWLLNRGGKIPFHISGQGQEVAQVAAALAMKRDRDWAAPYYRDLAFVLAWGVTPTEILLASFGRAEDPASGGRQMPSHWGHKPLRVLSGSSPVATQVPHAVGVALAAKLKGEQLVVYTSLGEGSSNQGDFHEGLNVAGVHKLPVICHVENNQYAISVPLERQLGCAQVADRAIGYGLFGERVDGNDFFEVYGAFAKAVARAEAGEGGSLIESLTYRLVPHSSDDDDRTYRSREEVEAAKQADGIAAFAAYLTDQGFLDEAANAALEARVLAEIDEANNYAEAAAAPAPEAALTHVYGG